MHIVIIGNGIAGNSAAQSALRHPGAWVTLIDRYRMPFHSACILPDYIAGSISFDKVIFKPFPSKRLKKILGEEVQEIDLLRQKVLLNKKTIQFDKLILATGSRPSVPPVLGVELIGNFCLKHLWDADQIRKYPAQQAVVVGSGLIGLEVAAALKKRGQSVTIIENQERLGPRILDFPVAEWVKNFLEGMGIRIFIKESVRQIFGEKHVKALQTTKRLLKTDIVVWATGMQPEINLAKKIGLKIGDQGGVIVRESMETSIPSIYAAGDLTEYPDPLLGQNRLNFFWYVAAAQGRIAGLNSVGIRSELAPFLQMGTARFLEINLAFVGYTKEELMQKGLFPDTKTIITRQGLIHHVYLEDRLVGLQMVNPTKHELLMANRVLRSEKKDSNIPWYFKIQNL